jgi:ribosomal protein S18 acetylase RimI-like enzyme
MATDAQAGFTVRRMKRGEVDLIREWATAEGWNPGLHDADCFYGVDPDGFFLGELDGEPIACISCVAYDDSFGFLGQYIVRPAFRGQGYGIQVWRAGMSHLGDRNVGLDGVVAQQENYRKSGFRFAHSHIRYRGVGGGEAAPGVVALSEVPFDELMAYDRERFPAHRTGFLRNWTALPGATALGCLSGGRLIGYGVIRPAVEGFKVGPLFADEPGVADTIFRSLLANVPSQPIVIDAPDETANPHVREFLQRHTLSEVFRTARMYTKTAPRLPLGQVYGVTSLELG